MPNFAFLSLAAIAGGAAYMLTQRKKAQLLADETALMHPDLDDQRPVEPRELSWEDVEQVDLVGLEVGYKLIPLVDKKQGGQLMSRIKGVRKKLTQELGFLVPSVHIRDKLELAPNTYQITLMGVPVGESEIFPEREMAINPGQVFGVIQGINGKDPAFGLDAVWIQPSQREEAQTMGYTVVDASTVVATHLSQIMQVHAHELLGREDVQHLLDNLGKNAPKLVEGLISETLPLGTVQKVLQNLLEERIPIRDMRTIAETLASEAGKSQDPAALTAAVRITLGRSIVQYINGIASEMSVITLDPSLEQILHNTLASGDGNAAALEPGLADRLLRSLQDAAQQQQAAGKAAVLLVSPLLRPILSRFVRHAVEDLHVLAYTEIPDNRQVKIVATVGRD
jgi:flagellar biosynthesis protein FlhA